MSINVPLKPELKDVNPEQVEGLRAAIRKTAEEAHDRHGRLLDDSVVRETMTR
jgi:hypothetical protein